MENNEYFIVQLELAKPKQQFAVVKTLWANDTLRLDLAQFEKCDTDSKLLFEFEAILGTADLQQYANDFGWSIDALIAKWKVSLSTADNAAFTYEIVDNILQWYKVDVIRVKYGCVKLTEVQPKYKLCIDLLLAAINQSSIVRKEHAKTCKELHTKEQHSADMKTVYDSYVAEQKAKEQMYLTKFMVLLNEKKARIRHLESTQIECNGSNAHDLNIPESDEIDINSTPDDFELPKRPRIDDAKPSTSYHQANNPSDDIFELETQKLHDSEELCLKL